MVYRKAELIAQVARKAEVTKTQTEKAMNTLTDTITQELTRGGRIALPSFGTFSVGNRKARTGRNPRTGEEIRIPAAKTPEFKPGTALKEAVR